MSEFLSGFALGAFVGCGIGMFTLALCRIAGSGDYYS